MDDSGLKTSSPYSNFKSVKLFKIDHFGVDVVEEEFDNFLNSKNPPLGKNFSVNFGNLTLLVNVEINN